MSEVGTVPGDLGNETPASQLAGATTALALGSNQLVDTLGTSLQPTAPGFDLVPSSPGMDPFLRSTTDQQLQEQTLRSSSPAHARSPRTMAQSSPPLPAAETAQDAGSTASPGLRAGLCRRRSPSAPRSGARSPAPPNTVEPWRTAQLPNTSSPQGPPEHIEGGISLTLVPPERFSLPYH